MLVLVVIMGNTKFSMLVPFTEKLMVLPGSASAAVIASRSEQLEPVPLAGQCEAVPVSVVGVPL